MKDMKSMKFGKHAIASFPPFMLFMPFMVKITEPRENSKKQTTGKVSLLGNLRAFPSLDSIELQGVGQQDCPRYG
jgi:hypothetical protein